MRDGENGERVILSVFPNRIGFGFAVLEGESLVDWGTKDLRRQRHRNALAECDTLLDRYVPEVLLLRDYDEDRSPRGRRINRLHRAMKEAARRRRITVHRFSRARIRERFGGLGRATKEEIAAELSRRFPELGSPMPRKVYVPEGHRMGTFDAVALAVAYLSGRERRGQKDEVLLGRPHHAKDSRAMIGVSRASS